MKLKFTLDYKTLFGQALVLNVLDQDGQVAVKHPMTCLDGHTWRCEVTTPGAKQGFIDYYYTVQRGDWVERHEWHQLPHRLDLAARSASVVNINDRWADLPDDSYLYSSAFTECVAPRTLHRVPAIAAQAVVMLKVRVPQLPSGYRMELGGAQPELGKWSPEKTISMVEHTQNEWVATLDAATLTEGKIEFKFLARKGKEVLWETWGNRTLQIPALRRGEMLVAELQEAYLPLAPRRLAGSVVPVFSLKTQGSFGVGDFGDLKTMIEWVASTGQRALQVLPINDTTITGTWTDSYPYNSISIYALHPQYTDLRQLPALNDLKLRAKFNALQQELNALPQIDYERVNKGKHEYLHALYAQEGAKVLRSAAFKTFFKKNEHWLVPYAAFCYYRDQYGTACFNQWPDHHSLDESERTAMANSRTGEWKKVAYWYYVQFNLDQQMRAAHDFARLHHVILKGDIPIGISRDGVEAWVEPKYFNLNGQAGAPPDAFSTNGQNWGFPTYNWDEMIKDGCSWWVKRFSKMQEYFDAYRIDHVLGFFRIWEIPSDAVYGLMGQFQPALPLSREEIESWGLHFQDYFLEPFITDWVLGRMFGDRVPEVRDRFLDHTWGDRYRLKPEFDTQRKIQDAFAGVTDQNELNLRDGLMSLVSDVLFLRDHKDPSKFHPRIAVQHDFIYEALYDSDKAAFNRLYNDYYYKRNNQFWYGEAMKKLPRMVEATRMLVCAEDLGMVPDCVPWVLNQLRILSLEIQSMPKDNHVKFGVLAFNPYRSVCTISTHDMPTMRQWWDQDWPVTQDFYNSVLWKVGPAPHPMPADLAEQVVANHLNSPSMLCLLSVQDWLAIDPKLRIQDPDAERINIPANPRHYWRYRMHLSIEQLKAATDYNRKIQQLITNSGRQ